ncbi:MAG TPA: hypothetical protein VMF67_11530 [Rhizomicrobium sp.]|nr:hypothetical protein [Rhizomicrobium sp.]
MRTALTFGVLPCEPQRRKDTEEITGEPPRRALAITLRFSRTESRTTIQTTRLARWQAEALAERDDAVFRSFAERTQRAIFERPCREGEQTVAPLTAEAGVRIFSP